jgi:YidC/Oxa1 family membrane protein insertase
MLRSAYILGNRSVAAVSRGVGKALPKYWEARSFATDASNLEGESSIVSVSPVEATFDRLFQEQESEMKVLDVIDQSIWDPTWYNVADIAVETINAFRDVSALSYGESIIWVTLLIRVGLFPIFVIMQRNTSRIAHMQPEMTVLKKKLEDLGDKADAQVKIKYGMQMRSLFEKYDCNPITSLIGPVVQIPVFMGMFFGLQKMPNYFSDNLSVEGILWFQDLTVYDPLYILPVLSAMTILASVEVNKQQMVATNPAHGNMMVSVFRAFSIITLPFLAQFPAVLNLYWVTNNSVTTLQAIAFSNKRVRKILGIWDLPKPVAGMPKPQGIMESIQNVIERKPSESDKIKAHNKNIDVKKTENMLRKNMAMVMKPRIRKRKA